MSRRARGRVAGLVGALILVVGCGGAGDADDRADPVPAGTSDRSARAPWGPFDEGVLVVRSAGAEVLEWCVLVADSNEERSRGLMDAPGPELGGFDGMAFVWDEDTTGGFWMKDTEVPLSIAYVAADGGIVSTADMDPCPPSTERCPGYPAAGPYRLAVEVPQGRLGALGIEPGATVALERRACPAP